MTSKPLLSLRLPMFDAPVASSAVDGQLARHGAVVMRKGDDYELVFKPGDAAGVGFGGGSAPYSGLAPRPAKTVSQQQAFAAGFDFMNPKVGPLHNLCVSLQSPVIVGLMEQERLGGSSMVMTFIDQNFGQESAEFARRIYSCPRGDWIGDEPDARRYGYQCPNHGDTLG